MASSNTAKNHISINSATTDTRWKGNANNDDSNNDSKNSGTFVKRETQKFALFWFGRRGVRKHRKRADVSLPLTRHWQAVAWNCFHRATHQHFSCASARHEDQTRRERVFAFLASRKFRYFLLSLLLSSLFAFPFPRVSLVAELMEMWFLAVSLDAIRKWRIV